jgi:uncharacterized protein
LTATTYLLLLIHPYSQKETPIQLEIHNVTIDYPEGCNIILGQTHFIKTAEDQYEIMATTVPLARLGIAFSEAS